MSMSSFHLRLLVIIVIALVVFALIASAVVNRAHRSRSIVLDLGEVPDFEFTRSNGQPYGLNDMKGKLNVVDFIFTNCKGACPIMSANMLDLYHLFQDSEEVRFVSISVDPERDTLETLKRYADSLGVADDRWVFLSAPVDSVIDLCENGFMMAAENLPMGHPTKFVLVDANGVIRSYHDGLNEQAMNRLVENIVVLARETDAN